jgi:lysophospholipid acyltransferase (LPLAT)-like uncharacterized protein
MTDCLRFSPQRPRRNTKTSKKDFIFKILRVLCAFFVCFVVQIRKPEVIRKECEELKDTEAGLLPFWRASFFVGGLCKEA